MNLTRHCLLTIGLAAVLAAQAASGQAQAVFNFGKIRSTQRVQHRFLITNPSQVPLRLLSLRPDCGCTSVLPERRTLGPGESIHLDLTLDPAGLEGHIRKVVEVQTDDKEVALRSLVVEAEVVPNIRLSANVLTFPDLPRDGGGLGELRLQSLTGEPVRVISANPDATFLSVQVEQEGLDAVLHLRVEGRKLPGGQRQGAETLDVVASNPERSRFSIRVLWSAETDPDAL